MTHSAHLEVEVPPEWEAAVAPLVAQLEAEASADNPLALRPVVGPAGETVTGYVECATPFGPYRYACIDGLVHEPAERRAGLEAYFAAVGFPATLRLSWWQVCSLLFDFRELDTRWIPWNARVPLQVEALLAQDRRAPPELRYDAGGATLSVERERAPGARGPGAGPPRPVPQRLELRFEGSGAWSASQYSYVDTPEGGRWRPDAVEWSP